MTFEERAKKLMEEKGMNQKELSIKSGISEPSLSRYLKGTSQPRKDILVNLAKAFDVDVSFLLLGESDPNPFLETKHIVARNRSTLSDTEKNEIIRILLGGNN